MKTGIITGLLGFLPLMGVIVMLQYLDKAILSYAALLGLTIDLKLQMNEYNWACEYSCRYATANRACRVVLVCPDVMRCASRREAAGSRMHEKSNAARPSCSFRVSLPWAAAAMAATATILGIENIPADTATASTHPPTHTQRPSTTLASSPVCSSGPSCFRRSRQTVSSDPP